MRNRRVLGAALAGAVVVALAVAAIGSSNRQRTSSAPLRPTPPVVHSSDGGRQSARSACSHLARFEALVRQNARADLVRAEIDSSVADAVAAARIDGAWLPLSGALGALRKGVQDNDAQETGTGIDVSRYWCRQADVAGR
jgi:hypothetical protein